MSTSLATAQPSSFIESLLQELEAHETSASNESMRALEEEDEPWDDGPVVYTATNAADWRLGTIDGEEGAPAYWQTKSNFIWSSTSDLEEYDSIGEEDGLTIGSAVNVNNIDAEREKEEGIQLCLEPFEDKIGKIEECLLSSGDITATMGSYGRWKDEAEHGPGQSTLDVSTVIQGNHNITYLRFGTGLEDDVTSIVASEYSGTGTARQTVGGEDALYSRVRMVIQDVTVRSRESGGSGAAAGEMRCGALRPGPLLGHGLPAAGSGGWEGAAERDEYLAHASQTPEVTSSWRHLYVRQPSAGAQLGIFTEKSDHSELSSNQLTEEVSQLRLENDKLSVRNRGLQSEVEELRRVKESRVEEDLHLKPKISEMTVELTHAKEALSALKADRKRLKAEKFDLLNQMKQLYATLEDKEKELRDFIRNYEQQIFQTPFFPPDQRMKDSDESLRHLASERDETEREKWNILKHARDESERVVKLSAQLGLKEATVKRLQEELEMVRKQLNSLGYYSDAESVRTNGLPTPTASTPTCSPLPQATPTPTPNGRGSSADSGVRVSSDRESTASHDGGPDTPKESPSLSPLYATPAYIRAGEDHAGAGDRTPTTAQTQAAMSGLANSSVSSGGLSRSAEQLCERLSEAGEVKAQGVSTLMRKSHKSGGTWGSISRVFARQKKRAALDTSIYDGSGSDKRASWSPSSSLCASPLTEESYSEKLRLLEEAQHIPLERWKAPTVLAWMEVTLGMAQYGALCAENIRSGKVLLELSDSELEAGLGITHPMHRKKLRLAIEELREPRLTRYPRISALGHTWVSSEWLPDLGLPHYSESFANSLLDGRLLDALTKKELEKHLGVHRKFHQASIIHGVHLLRIVRFDRQILAERRRQSEMVDTDPVVWTNLRWVRWARSIDLAEYADNLKDSGVHGALVVLEPSFTSDTMSTALGIPQSKNIIRRHLATELECLVNPARQQLDEQARYAKMERRRQEKLASGGSLGRSFSRSYGTGLEKGDKDKRRASLRGSLSRALGLRLSREETASVGSTNGGGESSSSGGQSPAVTTRAHPRHSLHARPRSSIMSSQAYFHHETHRRVKSIGDIETITVTPV
ncbi:Kazrin [Chionoecetes opilio]|uniref:Kazrin n=1 Tax=Chionoecetes opilio TaxID=41210 RepID=A0A8J4Y6U7_CHIOP|nr:Kazrin [Chionoecetes opilio]